ncbi:MAG: hypothetical protein OEY94_03810 [Alphaproteobacteria bacterium]|nr:hypothetical protein [Alphaproteobacteria bacterium]
MMRFIAIALIISFPLSAKAETVQTLDNLCKTLSKHDIHGAEYVPGYDIKGNPVVPADLGQDLSASPDPVIIPVNIDLEKILGKAMPDLADFQSNIATIKIYEDGRITYNDKDIAKPLSELCSPDKTTETQEKITIEESKGNRQVSVDNVVSSDVIEGQYPDDGDKKPVYND